MLTIEAYHFFQAAYQPLIPTCETLVYIHLWFSFIHPFLYIMNHHPFSPLQRKLAVKEKYQE